MACMPQSGPQILATCTERSLATSYEAKLTFAWT
jgi:hypothetical protein